jgi:hypothetical protein
MVCFVSMRSFARSHEMISAGRKCVQTTASGWYSFSILTKGRVFSLSSASLRRSFFHGLSSASYSHPNSSGVLFTISMYAFEYK